MEKKYTILLTGKNKVVVDDLFMYRKECFTFITSSLRMDDLVAHLDICKPEIVICCLGGEAPENLDVLAELKRRITRDGIHFGIVGTTEDCTMFQEHAVYMADFIIERPVLARRNSASD